MTQKNDPRSVYADIIDLPHWEPAEHPRMGAAERAAQFAPYAALVGFGDMVREETNRWLLQETDDDEEDDQYRSE